MKQKHVEIIVTNQQLEFHYVIDIIYYLLVSYISRVLILFFFFNHEI